MNVNLHKISILNGFAPFIVGVIVTVLEKVCKIQLPERLSDLILIVSMFLFLFGLAFSVAMIIEEGKVKILHHIYYNFSFLFSVILVIILFN